MSLPILCHETFSEKLQKKKWIEKFKVSVNYELNQNLG